MSFKIAAFNIENFFDRARAFGESSDEARRLIGAVAALNDLFEQTTYTARTKARILELVDELALDRFNDGEFARIRTIRGQLIRRPRRGEPTVIANGRGDWIGWAEHKSEPVDEIAIRNTGRVIRDVDADVLAVVEAENRVVLQKFTESVLLGVSAELPEDRRPTPYRSFMLIDGNDDRGIDVGLMTKPGFEIDCMRSHVNDRADDGELIFGRDCPEYAVMLPGGETLWVLPNHFKSKFGGETARTRRLRTRQATRVADIYRALRECGEALVAVVGDLNDTPDSEPLAPLLMETDLRDVSLHPAFDPGPFNAGPRNTSRGIGTFDLGNDNDKIDYVLLSPELFARTSAAGLFRKGAWPGSRPPRWPVYPELTEKIHVASDHHVIWATID